MLTDIAGDGVLDVGDGLEHAAPQTLAGQGGEEALDSVDPGRRGRGEVKDPARVALQPGTDLGMLVGGVVVGDGMDQLASRDGALDGVEKADELLMAVLGHTAAQHRAVLDVKRGEQGGDAVALVVVGHGATLARLERQPRLGAVKRLDLALLVDQQHHGMHWRGHVEANDVLDLLGEGRIVGTLEGA